MPVDFIFVEVASLQSRAKIIETTKSLPPSPHKQCWTDDTKPKVYCQVKLFFQH